MQRKNLVLSGVATGAVLAAAAAGVGYAVDGDDRDGTSDRGTCTSATWELEVERDDGGREVDFELQSAAPGETWQVTVDHDGRTLLSGTRTTDEDGEIDLDASAPGRDGTFAVTFGRPGEEPCTATARR